MASKNRGRRSNERHPLSSTSAPHQRTRKYSASGGIVARPGNGDIEPPAPRDFYCLTCDHEADATLSPSGRQWNIGSYSDRCPGGAECLRGIAQQLGCKPWQLLDDPRPWLEHVATVRGSRTSEPQALPTKDEWIEWRSAAATGEPRRYLRNRRGLTRDTIVQAGIGYGSVHGRARGFVIPVYELGEQQKLVQLMIRHWPDPWRPGGKDRKITVLRGRGSWLYPSLPREGRVILCEGPFDALLGWQHGLPTVTTTCGATLPVHLADWFRGRDVTVLYDVGADTRLTVQRLVAAGAKRVRGVDLAAAGLRKNEDLTDFFVWYGKTATDLRRLIRRAEVVR